METKLKNKISLMETLAENITFKINKYSNKEGLELQKMKLGLEILLINISKFFMIFVISAIFNLVNESLLMLLVFASIRRNAFGLHSKSSIVCTSISVIMFVFGSYLSYYLKFNNYTVFTVFVIINILLYKYAPADTEHHPLLGCTLRTKLRKESLLTGMLLMLLALIIPSSVIKTLITLATSFEVIGILPITYNLLKRRYRNYEKYEKKLV